MPFFVRTLLFARFFIAALDTMFLTPPCMCWRSHWPRAAEVNRSCTSIISSIDIPRCMEALNHLLVCRSSRSQCLRVFWHVIQYEVHLWRDSVSWEVHGKPIPETDCSSRQLSDLHDHKMQSAGLHVVPRQVDHWSLESQFDVSRSIFLNQFVSTTQPVFLDLLSREKLIE